MKIIDVKDMPNYKPTSGRSDDDVTQGKVYLFKQYNGIITPYCIRHGAMNKLTRWGLWRCFEITYISPLRDERLNNDSSKVEMCWNGCYEVSE